MNAPDISNIESKPTVVLVSNQSEFDQLMQYLERDEYAWNGYRGEKPTEWRPSGFLPPYIINLHPDKKITWGLESNETPTPFPEYAAKHIKPTNANPFQKGDVVRVKRYLGIFPKGTMFIVDETIGHEFAKINRGTYGVICHVRDYEKTTASQKTLRKIQKRPAYTKEGCGVQLREYTKEEVEAMRSPVYDPIKLNPTTPKRDRIRIERKKYDELIAERDRLQADNAELRKDNDIWRKAGRETEQQKEKALAIIELQGIEIEKSNNSWEIIISAYNSLSKELDEAKDERDRLQAEVDDLKESVEEKTLEYKVLEEYYKKVDLENATLTNDILQLRNANHSLGMQMLKDQEEIKKANELLESWKDEAMQFYSKVKEIENGQLETNLRDQRDMARFIAALLLIVSVGFTIAVWIGKLVPVI